MKAAALLQWKNLARAPNSRFVFVHGMAVSFETMNQVAVTECREFVVVKSLRASA